MSDLGSHHVRALIGRSVLVVFFVSLRFLYANEIAVDLHIRPLHLRCFLWCVCLTEFYRVSVWK